MTKLNFFDCESRCVREEQIYGKKFLEILYSDRWYAAPLLYLTARFPLVSALYGWVQKWPITRRKVKPFIEKFKVDSSEFEKQEFDSFNDFFIRKLKSEARPIDDDPNGLIFPCDGRFRLVENPEQFSVKGSTFSADELLGGHAKCDGGPIVICRLAPVDYHRFHFPCACTPSEAQMISGPLYSVNPLADRPGAYSRNRRMLTTLETEKFGKIFMVEVGATNVGSIKQTYLPNKLHAKGDEKGYFEFGGSAIVLVFERRDYIFSEDLVENSQKGLEIYTHYGHNLLKSS